MRHSLYLTLSFSFPLSFIEDWCFWRPNNTSWVETFYENIENLNYIKYKIRYDSFRLSISKLHLFLEIFTGYLDSQSETIYITLGFGSWFVYIINNRIITTTFLTFVIWKVILGICFLLKNRIKIMNATSKFVLLNCPRRALARVYCLGTKRWK